jgi:phosphatidylglycerophosphate synthase
VRDHNPSPSRPPASRAHRSLVRALVGYGLVMVAVAAAYVGLAGSAQAAFAALATFLVVATLVHGARARLPAAPLSLATYLTLARATLTAALAGLCAEPRLAGRLAAWILVVAAVELALDNLDGQLARRRGEASEFGARLDGEIDALFVLVLSVLAFHRGRAEGAPAALVLGIGAFRYALLAAALAVPWLRGEVPSSLRAKIICNVAIGTLLFDVAPFTPVALRTPMTATALVLLAWSFSFDVRYLRARRTS